MIMLKFLFCLGSTNSIHYTLIIVLVSLYRALTFVYPYGATLAVMKPAVAVLSTGSVCFPLNRPVLAFHQVKVRTQSNLSFTSEQIDYILLYIKITNVSFIM